MKYDHQILPTIGQVLALPLVACNMIFIFWSFLAFKRTGTYLIEKGQQFKQKIIFKVFLSFGITTIAAMGLELIEVLTQRTQSKRDEFWRSNAWW